MHGATMRFIKIDSTSPVIADVKDRIGTALAAGQGVVWLVSGGSAVQLEVAIMNQLAGRDLERLTIMQIDERYGVTGHADSNWQKLLDAGFVPGNARCMPMLTSKSFEETIESYATALAVAFQAADLRIGLLGMGADGHTAGILPGSSAAQETTASVAGYQGPDFLRITLTEPALIQLDAAIVYAVGAEKLPALERLRENVPISEQPAQILKHVRQVYIYNDQIEGAL